MCYLVAKDRDAHGCFALKTKHGKHLVELKKGTESGGWVSGRTAGNDQQTNGLWEYAPYHFVDTEQEFRMLVKGHRP